MQALESFSMKTSEVPLVTKIEWSWPGNMVFRYLILPVSVTENICSGSDRSEMSLKCVARPYSAVSING